METNNDKEMFLKAYQDGSNTLRTWFVGYGIGGPVIFLVNDSLYQKLVALKVCSVWIVYLFLLGLFSQILIAFTNKTLNWILYYGEENPEFQEMKLYICCEEFSNHYWVDFVCDVITLSSFFVATIILVNNLV